MLFVVISETLYSYSCNNRKLVCSMLGSAIFHKTSPRSLGWNTALLSIEQTSFLLLHEYDYKVSDITMNNIGTPTLRHPQLLYASSRRTSSSGTTTTVVNSTPQGLWLGHNLARTHDNHQQAIKQSWHHLQSGMYLQAHNNHKHQGNTIT